jgi:nucleoside-diphosphate-sugar epimerase
MRVLITGHKGYIGTAIVPLFLSAGHDVSGLDSGIFEDCIFGGEIVQIPEIRRDLRDVERADLKGFDAVVHLAALCNDPLSDLRPELTFEINHAASLRFARLAKEAGVKRFLISSSCSIYGAAGDNLVNESAPFNPVTVYGQSKVMLDTDVSKLADDSFSPTYLRNATAYGVSPRLRLDLVLNNLVASAYTTGRIFLKSDGTPWRPIVHIQDIGRAFLAALAAPRKLVHNESFNIGQNDENYQIRELAELVAHTVPGCRIEYAPDAGPDTRCYRVDFGKVRQMLPGFRPAWNAKKGAQELFEAFRQYDLPAEDVEGPRFKRVAHVKRMIENGQLDPELRVTNRRATAGMMVN